METKSDFVGVQILQATYQAKRWSEKGSVTYFSPSKLILTSVTYKLKISIFHPLGRGKPVITGFGLFLVHFQEFRFLKKLLKITQTPFVVLVYAKLQSTIYAKCTTHHVILFVCMCVASSHGLTPRAEMTVRFWSSTSAHRPAAAPPLFPYSSQPVSPDNNHDLVLYVSTCATYVPCI